MARSEAWQVSTSAAEFYEQAFVPALFARWAPLVADAVDPAADARVLDVGCGTGVLAREAARRVGPSGRVTGVDINRGMLAVARARAPDIDWREADAEALPFEDGAFDTVLSQFALMFFSDRARALAEMWRVLAPGGRLALAVWGPIGSAPAEVALEAILRQHAGDSAAAILRAPFALGDPDGLDKLLKAAGIEGAGQRAVTGEACFDSLDGFVRTEIEGSPLAEVVDGPTLQAILEDARGRLAGFAEADGRFRFPIAAHVVAARKP